jgi:hypothetical protein
MRPRTSIMIIGIAALAAACTSPVASTRHPGKAAFDSGMGMGSGNRSDSTAIKNAPTGPEAGAAGASVSESQAIAGGMGMGSGN